MQNTTLAGLLFLTLTMSTGFAPAWGGGYEETAHGSPILGAQRTLDYPRGSCGQCHSSDGGPVAFAKGLWMENNNELCYTCHPSESLIGVYQGPGIYETSSHRTDPRFVWPGPFPQARRFQDQGKCLNCHAPHGKKDRLGLIPGLLIAREENLCLTCHDGNPSQKNIAMELRKPFRHEVRWNQGVHRAEESGPGAFSFATRNRHVECSDCHNPHAVHADPLPPTAPEASNRNARVSRVRVFNGGPGALPHYQFVPAGDITAPVLEYEICFKCHSSWTEQPSGQLDLARLFNTNNASFHPVEGPGKNLNIDPNAFVGGKNAMSTIYCGDCHGSENPEMRGPHGSIFPNLLRREYQARSSRRVTTENELCFLCHNFQVYAGQDTPDFTLQASRFNPPATVGGHSFHVGRQNFPCYACHDSHGSARFGALMVTGRNPGLVSFNMNPQGGSCLPTCHGVKNYSLNYPR